MSNITITIRYGGETETASTPDDIILEDLLQQLADLGRLPKGQKWEVKKKGSDIALELGKTLEDNKVVDGDTLNVGLTNSGG